MAQATTFDPDALDRDRIQAIRAMLGVIAGSPARCRDCKTEIWFVPTKAGRVTPYTEEAISHFVDCPAASQFRRNRNDR